MPFGYRQWKWLRVRKRFYSGQHFWNARSLSTPEGDAAHSGNETPPLLSVRVRQRGAEMRRPSHHATGETNHATGTQTPMLNIFTREQIAATMRLRCEKAFPRRAAAFIFFTFSFQLSEPSKHRGEMASQLRERCGNDFRRHRRSVTPSSPDVSIDQVPPREFQPLLSAQPAK